MVVRIAETVTDHTDADEDVDHTDDITKMMMIMVKRIVSPGQGRVGDRCG